MEAPLERARGAVAALEAALALEGDEGDVPARLLAQHLADTRRRQKLLLTQLRGLRRLLAVLEEPGPPREPPPTLQAPGAAARSRWRGLKSRYWEALEELGGALGPAQAQLGRGRRLLRSLRQKEELVVKLREAAERRDQLQRRVLEQRRQRGSRQGALRGLQGAVLRAGAGCRLYQSLGGGGVLPLPHPEVGLGPETGACRAPPEVCGPSPTSP